MINKNFFFDSVRASLFTNKLIAEQVAGMEAILSAWDDLGQNEDDRHLAYMLATTYHETAATMQPIEEYGKGKKYRYGKRIKLGGKPYTDTEAIFYGRGFVQLTWYENYQKAGKKLGLDMLRNPGLALRLDVATQILFAGMNEGWFTGKELSHYFNETKDDWVNARRIINGLDKAQLIADYGRKFHAAISHKPNLNIY